MHQPIAGRADATEVAGWSVGEDAIHHVPRRNPRDPAPKAIQLVGLQPGLSRLAPVAEEIGQDTADNQVWSLLGQGCGFRGIRTAVPITSGQGFRGIRSP